MRGCGGAAPTGLSVRVLRMVTVQTYPHETVKEVLAANDIADIVGASVALKPSGAGRLKGLCPFHAEKTPSFTVSRPRQMYHCFGCGKGGDALDFLQAHEGLTFVDALRKLADRAGMRLPALSQRDNAAEFLREQLFKFGQFAADYFQKELAEPLRGSAARQYVNTRQLKTETVRRFILGFAPDSWSNLLDAARAKGFNDAVVQACGLFKQGERGGWYDFFRNRVMFPIRDISGNIVAFGGRDMAGGPAKYINSPETAVYKKSRVLYGLFESREAMRREKRALLVEGYFDYLRCFDAGIENVVASCGTALTPEQALLLKRYVPEVVMVYDGDAAGIRAALRGTSVLSAAGLTVRAMALPDNLDPDDFIKTHGREAFLAALDEAADFVTFYVRMSSERAGTIEGRTEIAQEVFEILRQVDDPLRVDEYLKRLASELRLNEQLCRTEFHKFQQQQSMRARPVNEPAAPVETPAQAPVGIDDARFLAYLLRRPDLREVTRNTLGSIPLPEDAFGVALAAVLDAPDAEAALRVDHEEARRLLSAACADEEPGEEERDDIVHKRLNRLQHEAIERRAAQVTRDLQEAERQGDTARMLALLAERSRLAQKKEQVGAA